MTVILMLRELWQRKFLVIAVTFIAAAVAATSVYQVSFSPPSLSKRETTEAKGTIEILVDSNRSPLGDVARNVEPYTVRAGVFARYMAGGNVIRQVATETGIPYESIEVAGPAPLPGEAVGITAAPEHLKPYGIAIVQRDELPIVNVETRAPTVEEAEALAAAMPDAVRTIVSEIQDQQEIPISKRVTFRTLGPAQAAIATEALGAKVAVVIFIALEIIGLLLILGIPRLVKAWRTAGAAASGPPQLEAIPHVPPRANVEAKKLPSGEELTERARAGMRPSGDG